MAQSRDKTSKSLVLPEFIEDIRDKKLGIVEGEEIANSFFDKRGRAIHGDVTTRRKASYLLREIIAEIRERDQLDFEKMKELLKGLLRPARELDVEARIAGVDFQRGGNRFLREATIRIPEALAFIEEAEKRAAKGKLYFEESIDYSNRIQRLNKALDISVGVTDAQLQWEYHNLRKYLSKIPEISNVLRGICLPVILVQRHNNDTGEVLNRLIDGAQKSYNKAFSEKKFKYCLNTKDLSGRLEIVEESGYQKVWNKKAEGDTVALFFPYALFGYSVDDQRKMMEILSKFGFILSGDLEPFIMYPDFLAAPLKRNANVSLYLSAFSFGPTTNALEVDISHQAVALIEEKYPGTPFVNKTGSLLFF